MLSLFPSHASGSVGNRLPLESGMDFVEHLHGLADFNDHWRAEDFTSRLDYLNCMDGILLWCFEYTWILSSQYRIAADFNAVEPPLIPIGSINRFFSGDEQSYAKQQLALSMRAFLDRVVQYFRDE